MVPKSAVRAVRGKGCSPPFMRLAEYLTARRVALGASNVCPVGKNPTCSVRHSRDARVYGHTTTAMYKLSTPPPSMFLFTICMKRNEYAPPPPPSIPHTPARPFSTNCGNSNYCSPPLSLRVRTQQRNVAAFTAGRYRRRPCGRLCKIINSDRDTFTRRFRFLFVRRNWRTFSSPTKVRSHLPPPPAP